MTAPKYDKSNLMKSAWNMFKAGKKYRNHVLTFAECLKEAWKAEKTRFTKAMGMYTLWNKAAEEQRKRDAGRNIKDKQSYQYYMSVLWLLRELTEAKCQKKDEAGQLYVDIQNNAFPILETTNELIGCFLQDGENLAINGNL